MPDEILYGFLGLVALTIVLGVPIALVVMLVRTSGMSALVRRMDALEATVRRLQGTLVSPPSVSPSSVPQSPSPAAAALPAIPIAPSEAAVEPGATPAHSPALPPRREEAVEVELIDEPSSGSSGSGSPAGIDWEMFIGRRALGWVAVVALLFGTAFFVRYAFENRWIGPLGRVSLGLVAGLGLIVGGWRMSVRGWRNFAHMLTAGGIVLLYLSTFSAFGFYHLIDQRAAGIFLFVIVAESLLLALAYDAWPIALMAIVGGLLTPILMHSDHDQFRSLFVYLAVLNAGAVGVLLRRRWPAVGTVALVGTQALFWTWYSDNYHPDKFVWAVGFQLVVYLLYLGHGLLVNFVRRQPADWEDLARMLLNAGLWFSAAYVLMQDDYAQWTGSLAVVMAAVYAGVSRAALHAPASPRLLLTALAVSTGFLALAFPLQADAPWIALGWAAQAAVLWWFGLRINSKPLRVMAAFLAALAVARVLVEVPPMSGPRYFLVFNHFALPALSVAACLLAGLVAGGRLLRRISSQERNVVAAALVTCLLLVAWIVSVDLVRYCNFSHGSPRLAQMSLSSWWAVYATILLVIGFATGRPLLRWTALGLYALTVGKVFLVDMSGLDQIFRIVAFFVLAILLGLAAWIYQRIQPEKLPAPAVIKEK